MQGAHWLRHERAGRCEPVIRRTRTRAPRLPRTAGRAEALRWVRSGTSTKATCTVRSTSALTARRCHIARRGRSAGSVGPSRSFIRHRAGCQRRTVATFTTVATMFLSPRAVRKAQYGVHSVMSLLPGRTRSKSPRETDAARGDVPTRAGNRHSDGDSGFTNHPHQHRGSTDLDRGRLLLNVLNNGEAAPPASGGLRTRPHSSEPTSGRPFGSNGAKLPGRHIACTSVHCAITVGFSISNSHAF